MSFQIEKILNYSITKTRNKFRKFVITLFRKKLRFFSKEEKVIKSSTYHKDVMYR